jgi:Bacterial PH domain
LRKFALCKTSHPPLHRPLAQAQKACSGEPVLHNAPGVTLKGVRIAPASRAGQQTGVRTFRSPFAVVLWWVWLAFAVANLIDLAVQGRDHTSAVAAAILVLITGVAYVTALRPRLVADDAGLTIVNPLRDHRIAWPCVTKVDVAELLRVHCDWGQPGDDGDHRRVIYAWAIHYSRRRAFTNESKARRSAAGRSAPILPGVGSSGHGYAATPPATAESEAQKIAGVLDELAATARHDAARAADAAAIDADGVGPVAAAPRPPRATWSLQAIAALALPALLLLIACLL